MGKYEDYNLALSLIRLLLIFIFMLLFFCLTYYFFSTLDEFQDYRFYKKYNNTYFYSGGQNISSKEIIEIFKNNTNVNYIIINDKNYNLYSLEENNKTSFFVKNINYEPENYDCDNIALHNQDFFKQKMQGNAIGIMCYCLEKKCHCVNIFLTNKYKLYILNNKKISSIENFLNNKTEINISSIVLY